MSHRSRSARANARDSLRRCAQIVRIRRGARRQLAEARVPKLALHLLCGGSALRDVGVAIRFRHPLRGGSPHVNDHHSVAAHVEEGDAPAQFLLRGGARRTRRREANCALERSEG